MKRIAPLFALALIVSLGLASLARERGTRPEGACLPGPEATLIRLDLQGPSSVEENSMQRYALWAHYDDGSSVDVTERAEWGVDSPHAHAAGGALTVRELPADETVTLSAWITHGLALKAARTVTLVDRSEGPGGSFSARDRAPSAGERGAARGT